RRPIRTHGCRLSRLPAVRAAIKGSNPNRARSGDGSQAAREKLAAVAQAFGIDAVADALGQVPLDRQPQRGEALRGLKQGLGRNEVVARSEEHTSELQSR